MSTLHPLLLLLAFLTAPAIAQRPSPLEAEWDLRGSDLATWDVITLPAENDGVEQPRQRAFSLGLFGYQIDRRGIAHFPVHLLEEVTYDLALQVPTRSVREGDSFTRRIRYEQIRDHLPVEIDLVARVMEARHDTIRVDGSLRLRPPPPFDRREYPDGRHRVTGLTGEISTTFDVHKGMMTSSRVVLRMTVGHRDNAADQDQPPPPTEHRWAYRFNLRRIREYAPRRLGPSVSMAIDDGVAWLRDRMASRDGFGTHGADYQQGEVCIAALTLLLCGADRQEGAILELMNTIRGFPPRKTYEVALALMAMEAFYAPADEVAQLHAGTRRGPARRILSPEDRAWVKERVDWLLAGRSSDPRGAVWSYDHGSTHFDNSNTQYAVLGLLSAWRCGAMIDEDVWVDIAKWFLMAKEDRARKVAVTFVRVTDRDELTRAGRRVEARGFPYTVGGKGEKGEIYGSMTAGGIASLCIARDVLRTIGSRHMRGRLAKDLREAIDGGWGWFAEHWCIQRHPVTRGRGWCHYYLYALERAGVFSGLRKIDNRDWYAEGAEWLIETQEPDGRWILESGGVHSTCFALLFLKRGTVPVTTGD